MIFINWTNEEEQALIKAYETKTPIYNVDLLKNKDALSISRKAYGLGLSEKYPDFDYMVGQKFGQLTVIKKIENNKTVKLYECRCDCGNPEAVIVRGSNLRNNHTKSCGCLRISSTIKMDQDKCEDFTGLRFGHAVVLEKAESKIHPGGSTSVMWKCKCDCGKIFTTYAATLRSDNGTLSCGCMRPYYNGLKTKKYNHYDLSGDYGIGYDKNGREFYFDIEDYDKIKRFNWYVDESGYVISTDNENEFAKVRMHRIILDLYPGNSEILVDHIHGEAKYDNRKANLRIVNGSENSMNRKLMNTNTSGVTGVVYDKRYGTWIALITKDYNVIKLGHFKNFDDAVKARKAAEEKYFGQYSFANSQAINIDDLGQKDEIFTGIIRGDGQ